METLPNNSSSSVTVQQFVLVETLPDNSSSSVTVQQFVLVETLLDNSSSNVTVQLSVLVEILPDNSSSSVTVQQSGLVDLISFHVQLRISSRFGTVSSRPIFLYFSNIFRKWLYFIFLTKMFYIIYILMKTTKNIFN